MGGGKPGSSSTVPVILLTGRPGIGKTTAIRHVAAALGDGAGGFYTREVRASGQRIGFELVTLSGETALLATNDRDVTFQRQVPFGRYRVNLDAVDAVGVPALLDALDQGQVVVVDEIGPMEILSPCFRDAIPRILDSGAAVVGAIVLRPQPFADRVKAHPKVTTRTITAANRDDLPGQILSVLAHHGLVRCQHGGAEEPTLAQVDDLLRFLPLFDVPNRDYVERWAGGEKTGNGAITMPYPVYPEDVQQFYRLAGQSCWSDYGYDPRDAGQMLEDDVLVQHATLAEIKTMLTYCVRGERFCDGHWAAMLESGKIVALLKRLRALRPGFRP